MAPATAAAADKPLFDEGRVADDRRQETKLYPGSVLWLNDQSK